MQDEDVINTKEKGGGWQRQDMVDRRVLNEKELGWTSNKSLAETSTI